MANKQISGLLVNLEYREVGDTDWIRLVCTSDSTFTITSDITKQKTNCGIIGAPGTPDFNASGNAVYNIDPGTGEASYNDVKELIKAGTQVQFRYINAADAPNSITLGQAFNNFGLGYFTELTATASAEDDGFGKFSWTLEGIGELDDFDES